MTGKGAIEVTDRMFTIAPLERINDGKNACVTLSGPRRLTSSRFWITPEIGQVFELPAFVSP
jgi:hypothetical protein